MLGERLRSLRNSLGKTQSEVAKELGISRAAYSHIENNRNEPDNSLLVRMADYYKVTTDYLLGRSVPDWATEEDVMDLEETLTTNEIIEYGGKKLTAEEKEQVRRLIEAIFWESLEEKRSDAD